MSLKKALLAATMLSLPIAAQAQPITGLYVGAGAGVNYRQDSNYSLRGAGVNLRDRTETRVGYAGVGSIGWGFGNGFRAEIEGNYRYNQIDHAFRGSRLNGGGVHQYGAMVNALYDFDLTGFGVSPRTFSPYLGVGVGYIWSQYRNVRGAVTGASLRLNDTDGQFAYQGIVGGAFGLGDVVPGLALTVEYRFMGTLEPTINGTLNGRAVRAEGTNYNHTGLVGLRYAFNAPRPVPVAAPVAPAPVQTVARTYLVFFDWNRADLTDRARQIIAEAATARTTVSSTRIEVSGHADRSGTPQYNQALSMRRAESVAAELARRGVPRSEMVIQAFGESRPLVPTADGVREPQNRRVEIVLK